MSNGNLSKSDKIFQCSNLAVLGTVFGAGQFTEGNEGNEAFFGRIFDLNLCSLCYLLFKIFSGQFTEGNEGNEAEIRGQLAKP
jgi:hypothetical protein